jgi:hypothetical protein
MMTGGLAMKRKRFIEEMGYSVLSAVMSLIALR